MATAAQPSPGWDLAQTTQIKQGRAGAADCTLHVTGLLQNGQFILAFKSLIGRAQGDYPTAAGGHWTTKKLLDVGWWANRSRTPERPERLRSALCWRRPVIDPMEGRSLSIINCLYSKENPSVVGRNVDFTSGCTTNKRNKPQGSCCGLYLIPLITNWSTNNDWILVVVNL